MSLFRNPTSIALCTVLLTSFAGSAIAANSWNTYDRKSYTGAQCQPATGSQSSDFVIFAGLLRNMSHDLRWASCAITLDQETTLNNTDFDNSTASGAFELSVYLDYSAVAAGPALTTNCTIRSVEPFSTSKTVTKSVTSAKTGPTQSVIFSASDLAVLNSVSIGSQDSLQLSCRLPSAVAIKVVKVYEWGDTGHYRWIP